MERQERIRQENPRSNREYTQEELGQAAIEHAEREAELEESYQEARQRRFEEREAEWEEWREKRRQERQTEQERYEEIKEERKSAKLNEENADWNACLRYLGGCKCE